MNPSGQGLQLTPSPSRSAVVAALLQRAQQNQGRGSKSLAESLDIAASPILASLLARREEAARQQQTERQRSALSQALGIPPVSPVLGQTAPPWNEQQKRMSALLQGLPPEGLQAATGALLQQTIAPKSRMVPLTVDEKKAVGILPEVFAQRDLQTGKIETANPPGPLVQIDQGPPLEKTVGPDGKPVFTPRKQAVGMEPYEAPKPPKEPTENDKKNQVLYDSMLNAEKQIQDLKGKPGATDTGSLWQGLLGGINATKVLQSDAYRSYEAAGLRWAANLLYLKSGATANPDEVRSTWKQFFPQPGEGPIVAAQKEQARLQEIESVRSAMVPGAKPFVPENPLPKVVPMTNAKGWVLHEDAQGNKAYVDPKNPQNFEEVK